MGNDLRAGPADRNGIKCTGRCSAVDADRFKFGTNNMEQERKL